MTTTYVPRTPTIDSYLPRTPITSTYGTIRLGYVYLKDRLGNYICDVNGNRFLVKGEGGGTVYNDYTPRTPV